GLFARAAARGSRRLVHPGCERARANWRQRQRRVAHPGVSTPYGRAYRERRPDKLAEMRAKDKARQRARWPTLPPEQRAARMGQLHQWEAEAQELTLARAQYTRSPWTADEAR